MAKSQKSVKSVVIESVRMMGDRVLIIQSDEDGERATRGGLVIPATAGNDRRLKWGEVLSVGPNTRHVSKGDRVLYAPDSGFDAEISGESYLILRERDIHGVTETRSDNDPGMYL